MSGNMAAAFADANRPTVALQNPLDIYGKAADVVNALNANKAFRARQAAGEAYQQATDPTTGLVDPARAQALIAANPVAAVAAQPSATSGQALSQAQQSQGIQRNAAISQLLGPVLALPDAQLHDGAVAATQRAMQMGITTQQEGMTLLARLPNDPAALRQQLEQTRMSLLPPDQQRAAIYGSPLTYTAPGGTLAGGMQSQQTGAVSTPDQAGAPQGLSPEADSTPTQIGVVQSGPNKGAPIYSTRKVFRQMTEGQQTNVGPGRLPPALAPSQAQPPAAAPAQPQGIVTGLGPGATTAATEAAGASAKDFQGIADAGTQAQTRGAVLDNMLSDTSQFTTGPLSGIKEKVRALAGQFGVSVDTEKLSASESFNKLAAQLAGQQGAGSDARLAVGQAANPHADLSPAGVDLMLRQLRGNEDYLQARSKLAAAFPDRTDRTAFEAQIGSKIDPRTFQYDRMTPPQKMTYFKSLGTDKAKADFIKAHDTAASLLGAQ